jgi:predicted DNA-binding transcriptional regulator YafY
VRPSALASVALRRHRILALLAERPHRRDELRSALRPEPAERTLAADLAWLRREFPGRLLAEQEGRALRWRFVGEAPHVLSRPLATLDEDQVAALIAARGLLRTPDPAKPAAEDDGTTYHGTLSRAIDRLLHSAGLTEEARAIAPDAIAISRFGVAPEEEAAFPTCFAAIRAGAALGFTYTNNAGETHAVHAQPVRLIHIAGEWHLCAWAGDAREPPGKLKQYRLSRIAALARHGRPPQDCPLTGLRGEAAAQLRDAFRATGSARLRDRRTVVLAVGPDAWPFVEHRRWGDRQEVIDEPGDLPAGWRRLTFVTTGLRECRHWLLSFGAQMRAEAPPELCAWITEQVAALGDRTDRAARSAHPAPSVPP